MLSDHDLLQLQQAAAGATSGIAKWPALREAIQKVIAEREHLLRVKSAATAVHDEHWDCLDEKWCSLQHSHIQDAHPKYAALHAALFEKY